jgi:hypothetical protein
VRVRVRVRMRVAIFGLHEDRFTRPCLLELRRLRALEGKVFP